MDTYDSDPLVEAAGLAFSLSVRLLFLTMLGLLIANGAPLVGWWMIPVVLIFSADAAWTVRGTGKWGMLVASVLFIEVGYAWLLTVAIARGYFKQLVQYRADIHLNTWVKVRGANNQRKEVEMNLHTTANAGVGLASVSIVGVVGVLWAILLGTMLIAVLMALSHFIPRKTV